MSDPKSSYGEPVDEPKDLDGDADVVGRAHEGLAEAEAARREVNEPTADPEPSADGAERVVVEETVVERTAAVDSADEDEDARWAAYAASADVPEQQEPAAAAEPARNENDAPTVSHSVAAVPFDSPAAPGGPAAPDSTVAPGATAVSDSGASAYSSPAVYDDSAVTSGFGGSGAQPIFVQAPEAPRPRSNRGAAGAIGLLATVAFAVLYLGAWLAIELLRGAISFADVPQTALGALTTWSLWVPVVIFFLAFWLLGAFINRAGWGHWVIWGLLVGVAAWVGHLLGQLFQAPFWQLTTRQGAELLETQALAPLAIVAFVLGRELTIWFGAWVAARGRRVTELNDEAQREYERTLEAGPQLMRR